MAQFPCDSNGVCMVCKRQPLETETLHCITCVTPWHFTCLPLAPTTIADWECPDCSQPNLAADSLAPCIAGDLVSSIRAIENDPSLTDEEKAKKRQELVGGSSTESESINKSCNDSLDIFDGSLNCSVCMQLLERPVTTPCGHNFCLKCFEKCIRQGKNTCSNCRTAIPAKMACNPQIYSSYAMQRISSEQKKGEDDATAEVCEGWQCHSAICGADMVLPCVYCYCRVLALCHGPPSAIVYTGLIVGR